MASLEKLVRKFLCQPNAITVKDIERLLAAFGYEEKKKPGSERVFHKKGSYPINVPTVSGKAVKSRYIKRMVKSLNLEEWIEGTKGD